MDNALVVFSGGLDSTTALYWALEKYSRVECVSFHYGSHHNPMEYGCAERTANKLGVKLHYIKFGLEEFKSSLLNGEVPEGNYNEENMKSTVVPFRNGIMLSFAAGLADSLEIGNVILGNHAGDHFIYPDCRPEFIESMAEAIRSGTVNHVNLVSPFCNITKADIVALGTRMGVDYLDTYSCYKGGKIHCGKCGTCRERKEAFQLAGVPDPTVYES